MSIDFDSAIDTYVLLLDNINLWHQRDWRRPLTQVGGIDSNEQEIIAQTHPLTDDEEFHRCGTAYCFAGFHAARRKVDYLLPNMAINSKDNELDKSINAFHYDLVIDPINGVEKRIKLYGFNESEVNARLRELSGRDDADSLLTEHISTWAAHDLQLSSEEIFEGDNTLVRILADIIVLTERDDPDLDENYDTDEVEMFLQDHPERVAQVSDALDLVLAHADTALANADQIVGRARRQNKIDDLRRLISFISTIRECIENMPVTTTTA